MSDVLDEELRDVGFTANARNYPRDELGKVMLAAWLNVRPDQLPRGMHYMPNASSMKAWQRVGEAAVAWVGEGSAGLDAASLQRLGDRLLADMQWATGKERSRLAGAHVKARELLAIVRSIYDDDRALASPTTPPRQEKGDV